MKDQITPTALFQITNLGQTHVLKVHKYCTNKKEHDDDFISPAQRYHH